ncbi:MAG: hypothetical protein ABR907_06850 [Terracidiphilus sp.]
MRKILRLDFLSVCKFFAVLYAVEGLCQASKSVFIGDESVYCPVGILLPIFHATAELAVKLPQPASWLTPLVVLVSAASFTLTGICSAVTVVVLYNISAQFWSGLRAQVEEDEQHREINPEIDLN